ncbi:extracellular solute-binding protein [Ruminococcus sp. JL13D9]|uniref:extracellular solute-binding protein n=1 Tax=Ruminococcus sp. JL13D9 TaxID=3233381 RepID=UPI00389A67AA
MRKSKKFLSVTLALIIALSTLIVGTSAITVNAATPSKVTLVSTAYNTNATVTLGWTAASGANGYQIAKKRITDKGYTYLTSTGTSYNDKKVITGTIYYYQVRAFYKSGKNITYGAWSNSKSITTLYRPTVTSLNYLNNNLLNINWNKILGVSHYKLAFKRTIDKAWNYRNVKNTYFNISNPTKGTTYTIQVCPMNGTLAGQWSLVKSITIEYVPVKVSSIKLSQTSLSLTLGNSKTLSATVTPSNADNKVLQWSSSNTKVATVNQSGKVTSVSTGTATIYAKASDGSGKQAACSVTVNGIKVSLITVSPTAVSLKPGKTKSITATVSPSNAENKTLQWTSSNTKVATVNQSGTVTAVSDGTATIYAKATDGSGKQATCSVTVNNEIVDESLFGNENNITLKVWVPDKAVSLTKQQVEDFKRAYPGKTFKKIEVVGQGEGDAGIMLMNDPGRAADVMSLSSDMLGRLQKGDYIAPVSFTDTVSEENEEATVKAATINNKLYAYPETNDNGYLLVYDKQVVSTEQAKTLEGVLAACKNYRKKFVFDCSNGFYTCAFAFTAGIKINGFERDGYTQKFTQFDEDEAVATLQAFSKLMHDYSGTFTSTDVAQISSGFSTGTIGAGVDGTWNVSADKSALGSDFGAAKLPTINVNGKDKQMVPMVGYKYIGVNSASKFPASAQILALYLSGEKCQKQRAQQFGWGPTNKIVQTDPVVTNNPVLIAMKENSMVCVPQANIAPMFWSPMGNLGSKLIASNTNPSNKTYFINLINQTIANIRDE